MNSSIRLVRCPKCRKILPEPNIPVYKCGGCGATLQAKKHKDDIKGNSLRAPETVPIQKCEPSSGFTSSSPEGDHPSIESSPGKIVDNNISGEHSHSTEPGYLQDHKLSTERNEAAVQGKRERLLEKDAGPRKIESLDSRSEKSHGRTSDEVFESCDSVHEIEDSSAENSSSWKKYERGYLTQLNVVTSVNEIEGSPGVLTEEEKYSAEPKSLDQRINHFSMSKSIMNVEKEQQNIGKYTNDIEDSRGEFPQDGKHSNDSKADERKYLSRENDRMRQNAFPDQIVEYSQKTETTEGVSSFSMKDGHTAETSLLVAEKYDVADENRSHLEESNGPEKGREIIASTAPLIRSIVFAPLSTDDVYLKGSPEAGPNFHRVSSEEMLDTLPINPRVPIAPLSPDDVYLEGSPEVGPDFHRISSEEMLDTLPINPRVPIAPLSPDDRDLEESPEVGPTFHCISSEEMLDALPINPRVPIGSMAKSPTKIYYAGVESESSYDITQLSAHVSHQYSRKVKATGNTSTNRSRQKDGFKVKNKQKGVFHMPNEQFALLSKFKEPNKSSGVEQDWRLHESPEPRNHNRPIRPSITVTNNEPISRGSYMPRSSQVLHRNRSPASSTQNVFMHNSDFHQPDTMVGFDPEKVELLRIVYELKDKINHTHMSKQISFERSPFRDVGEEIRTGRYYDNPETGNPYVNFNYSGHNRSHPHSVEWANQPKSSRLMFSGEASQCRNHIGCRCSHCYHQDLQFSQKLSSHCIHCLHAAHPRHDYDNMYPSYSPGPQHYTSSELSREVHADNQKHTHEMKMSYLREKHQVMKRHLRPVSGGAPIVNCYHCSELLQLPVDFHPLRRRCQQLRCSSCNTILKFSLLKKSHLVPYVIKIQAPVNSEMDNNSNVVYSRTLASASHSNNHRDAGPVSFSDDLEPSFSRNGSTESVPSVPPPLSEPKNLSNLKLSSNNTSQAMNDRKMKAVIQDMNNNSRDNIIAAGPSSSTPTWVKPSSEIEELPAESGSPLHRLMGYESPRRLMHAKSEDESDDGMGYFMDQQIQ